MVSVFQWWGKRLQPGSKQSTRAQTCRRPVCISSHGWSHLRCCYHEGQAKSSKTTCMEPMFSLSCAKIWQDVLLILWFITFVSLTYLDHLGFLRGKTDYEEAQSESRHFLWTQGKPSSLLVMPSKSFRRKSPWQHHQQTRPTATAGQGKRLRNLIHFWHF